MVGNSRPGEQARPNPLRRGATATSIQLSYGRVPIVMAVLYDDPNCEGDQKPPASLSGAWPTC